MKTERDLINDLIKGSKKDDKERPKEPEKKENDYGVEIGVYRPKSDTKDSNKK